MDKSSPGERKSPGDLSAYARLHDDKIRLVKIEHRENAESGLSCELITCRLEDQQSYIALSYRWGSKQPAGTINLNGKPLGVGKNLWRFLSQASRLDQFKSTLFWIDALCINQDDSDERSHQVAIMPAIYSQARRVVVWLGPEHDNSKIALMEMERPLDRWVLRPKVFRQIWTTTEGAAIRSICSRMYWTRLWIFQELVLAKEIVVMCGDSFIAWESFRDFLVAVRDHDAWDTNKRLKDRFEFRTVRDGYAMSIVKQLAQEHNLSSLWDFMKATRELKCSDPRDKIYALLGVATTGCKGITPDYTTPFPTLLNRVLSNQQELQPPASLEQAGRQCHDLIAVTGMGDKALFSPESHEYRLQHSPNPNLEDYRFGRMGSPLNMWWAHYYGQRRIMNLLFSENVVEPRTLFRTASKNMNKMILGMLFAGFSVELGNDKFDHQEVLHQISRSKEFEKDAEFGDEEAIKWLVGVPAVNVDLKDKAYRRTPLAYAATSGHAAMVKLLLSTGKVDVNSKDQEGRTPLSHAAVQGHVAIVKALLATGKVDIDSKDREGRTPLSHAAACLGGSSEALVRLLLSTGKAEPDSTDQFGRTPFSYAAGQGLEATANFLLGTGKVDVDSRDLYGRTPLSHSAGWPDNSEALAMLLLGTGKVEPDSRDDSGRTPLSYSIRLNPKNRDAATRFLLSTGKVDIASMDWAGRTPLHFAVAENNEAAVRLLLSAKKVDIDAKRRNGQTPLDFALRESRLEGIARLLIATGKSDLNARCHDSGWHTGLTALSFAAIQPGNEANVRLLVDTRKVIVDLKDDSGRTALSWAAEYGQEGNVKVLLSTEEVDIHSRDNAGRTALTWAAMMGHNGTVNILTSRNGDCVKSKDNSGLTALFWATSYGRTETVRTLISTGSDLASKDNEGRTALYWATTHGQTETVRILISTGVDPASKDNDGRTALSWATELGHIGIVRILVSTGIDLDSRDNKGRTSFSWGAQFGQEGAMRILMNTGQVDIASKDEKGWTALSLAAVRYQHALVKYLLDTGKYDVNATGFMGRTALRWTADEATFAEYTDWDRPKGIRQMRVRQRATVRLLRNAGAEDPLEDVEHMIPPLESEAVEDDSAGPWYPYGENEDEDDDDDDEEESDSDSSSGDEESSRGRGRDRLVIVSQPRPRHLPNNSKKGWESVAAVPTTSTEEAMFTKAKPSADGKHRPWRFEASRWASQDKRRLQDLSAPRMHPGGQHSRSAVILRNAAPGLLQNLDRQGIPTHAQMTPCTSAAFSVQLHVPGQLRTLLASD